MLFTITNGGLQNGRPTQIGSNDISIGNRETYVYSIADFTTNTSPQYLDPEGDSLAYIEINVLPPNGELQLNGLPVSQGDQITAGQITSGNFKFVSPDTDDNQSNSWEFDCADSGSNSLSGLGTGIMTMISDKKVNQPPSQVGDRVMGTVNYDTSITFSSSDFTTNTTPPYADPEGDPPAAIKIIDLPSEGTLNYNGSPATVGSVVTISEIESGYLVWVPDVSAPEGGYTTSFNFSVSDTGSNQFTE